MTANRINLEGNISINGQKHYLSKKAGFWFLNQGKYMKEKILRKREKPSQEPSTPKMAKSKSRDNY